MISLQDIILYKCKCCWDWTWLCSVLTILEGCPAKLMVLSTSAHLWAVNLPLCPLYPLLKKIVILKTPTKNHFFKKCLLLGRGNKMMHYTMDTFFFSFVKSLEKKLQAQGTKSWKIIFPFLTTYHLWDFFPLLRKILHPHFSRICTTCSCGEHRKGSKH